MNSTVTTSDQVEFSEYARHWLAEIGPPLPPERLPITLIDVTATGQRNYLQALQSRCYEVGLLVADYHSEGAYQRSELADLLIEPVTAILDRKE